jgi:hypothetical protein
MLFRGVGAGYQVVRGPPEVGQEGATGSEEILERPEHWVTEVGWIFSTIVRGEDRDLNQGFREGLKGKIGGWMMKDGAGVDLEVQALKFSERQTLNLQAPLGTGEGRRK